MRAKEVCYCVAHLYCIHEIDIPQLYIYNQNSNLEKYTTEQHDLPTSFHNLYLLNKGCGITDYSEHEFMFLKQFLDIYHPDNTWHRLPVVLLEIRCPDGIPARRMSGFDYWYRCYVKLPS